MSVYDDMIVNNIVAFFYYLRNRGVKRINTDNSGVICELAEEYVKETYHGEKEHRKKIIQPE
jgi:hypothetical protein